MGRETIYLIQDAAGSEATATSTTEAGAKALELVGFRRVDRETYRRWQAYCHRLDKQTSKSQVRD